MTSNFLDDVCPQIQNMTFKTSKMDHIALEYWYNSFLGHLRVNGRGFPPQKPILWKVRQTRNQDAAHAQKHAMMPHNTVKNDSNEHIIIHQVDLFKFC